MKRGRWFLLHLACLLAAFGFVLRDAAAEERGDQGPGASGLPSLYRVGLPGVPHGPLTVAATTGFAWTERLGSTGGADQRLPTTVAAAFSATRWLGISVAAAGQYDRHASDAFGSGYSGFTLRPMATARASAKVTRELGFGVELAASVPAAATTGSSVSAASPDVKAMAAWSPRSGLVFTGQAGFRLDRSAEAGGDAGRLRPGDRVALGLSDSNAALLGVGLMGRIRRAELFGECTGDLLVGKQAPRLDRSPLRAAVGGRLPLGASWWVESLLEVSLSARPPVGPSDPLVPVEPRFTALVGLRYRFATRADGPGATPGVAPMSVAAAERSLASLQLRALGTEGAPVAGARVLLRSGGARREGTTGPRGEFEASVPVGPVELHLEAAGYLPVDRTVMIGAPTSKLDIGLEAIAPEGQIRGLVRSFEGRGLSASIQIEPGGLELTTDQDGFFEATVKAGVYRVTIRAPHYREQRREVTVEDRGVTVLNAELPRDGR